MEARLPEKAVRRTLKSYYRHRAKRLKTLKLSDIVATTPSVLWCSRLATAPDVVARLIEQHLVSFEDEWEEALQNTDFCMDAIRLDHEVCERFDYQEELDSALNRLSLGFIHMFCGPDYSIDWPRVLRSIGFAA
jgi:hypothetical protein